MNHSQKMKKKNGLHCIVTLFSQQLSTFAPKLSLLVFLSTSVQIVSLSFLLFLEMQLSAHNWSLVATESS